MEKHKQTFTNLGGERITMCHTPRPGCCRQNRIPCLTSPSPTDGGWPRPLTSQECRLLRAAGIPCSVNTAGTLSGLLWKREGKAKGWNAQGIYLTTTY